MRANLSTRERALRSLVIAPAAFVAALLVGVGSVLGIALLVVGLLMLATSAISFCPLYAFLRRVRTGRPTTLSH